MKPDPQRTVDQKLLGVGVPIQRHPHKHLKYVGRLREHADALSSGFEEPELHLAQRLQRLRVRLGSSPFYSTWLKRHGLSASELRSLEDLAHFPLLHRDQLGSHWGEAGALGVDPESEAELSVSTSSGSSGKAIPVLRDGYDQLHMWAAIRFWVERLGVKLPPRPRLAFLCALPGGLEYSTRLPHLDGGALHRISSGRPDAARRLQRIRPAILSSDPAGFHWLLRQDLELAPAILLTSAQHLSTAQRRQLDARFGVPLVNYYATTETGPIAWECCPGSGAFHSLQPDVYLESVAGEVVVTRLRDSVLPLLRYRTGDQGTVVVGSCSCGFRGRSLQGFVGRRACNFIRADGKPVDAWNLIWLFKDLPLVGFRMVQLGLERFEVQVDSELPMAAALLELRLTMTLIRMGWAAPVVGVRRVSGLPELAKPEPFLRLPDVPSSPAE